MNKKIDNYLQKLNWKFERINETTIVSGFKGKDAPFTFFIFDSDEWVIFLTYPNLIPIPEEKKGEISIILTKFNFDTPFVKFSMDDKGNVIIAVELHESSINEISVEVALDSLCSNAESLFDQLSDYKLDLEFHIY
jgi:hypothetical protein